MDTDGGLRNHLLLQPFHQRDGEWEVFRVFHHQLRECEDLLGLRDGLALLREGPVLSTPSRPQPLGVVGSGEGVVRRGDAIIISCKQKCTSHSAIQCKRAFATVWSDCGIPYKERSELWAVAKIL